MKQKRCKICKQSFTPFSTLSKVCGVKCAKKYAERDREKREKKEHKEAKERLKSKSDHIKDVQVLANKYARLRDARDGCISCDKGPDWGGQWHGSHYRPAGNCSSLRFHPFNINKACSECNNYKSGNLIEYRIRLIRKIGLENVEWLESQNQAYTWDVFDLIEMKRYFKSLIKSIDS